jgi:uncharacterized RDD family membrane protein YckC
VAGSLPPVSEQRDIVTPEAVVLGFERAGVASRAGAYVLDLVALAAVYLALLWLAVLVFGTLGGSTVVLMVVVSLAPYVGWFVTFEVLMGRTPGKAAFGLRVMGADGTPVRFTQAFLRAVTSTIELLMLPIVGLLVALLSRNSQRLGDLAGHTMVVRDRSAGSLLVSARFPPPYGYQGYVDSLDVSAMSERQYELVRRFLLRANDLRPQARAQVAIALANPLSRVLSHTPPRDLHPETFLACCAASWQQAHAPPGAGAPSPVMFYGPYAGPPPGGPGAGPPGSPPVGPQPQPPYGGARQFS